MGIVIERMSSINSSNQRVFIVCLPCVMHYSGHCNAAMMHEAPVGLPLKKDDCCARGVVVEFSLNGDGHRVSTHSSAFCVHSLWKWKQWRQLTWIGNMTVNRGNLLGLADAFLTRGSHWWRVCWKYCAALIEALGVHSTRPRDYASRLQMWLWH